MTHSSQSSPARAALAASLLLLVCVLAFWWRLGYLGLIDPDEPFYVESSREMLAANDWVVPRIFERPQFEKPALIYWLEMASMRAFGDTEFAARAPAALFATLLGFLTLAFGARAFGPRAGFLAAVVLATCLEIVVSGRMVLTDVVFAFFLCGSVFSLWMAGEEGSRRNLWFLGASAASGLAALTKGPLGILIPALGAVALIAAGRRVVPRRLPALAGGAAVFALIAVPWYALMLDRFGRSYADAFFLHENVERFFHAEHPSNNRLYYYLGVLAVGSAPWLPVLPAVVARAGRGIQRDRTVRFLVLWGLLCLVFFTLAASKLPTYVLFLFVPLALLAGRALDAMLREGRPARWEVWVAGALGLAQAAALFLAPRYAHYPGFALPLGLVGAVILTGVLLLALRLWSGWIGATALAGLAVPVFCLGLAGPAIDGIVSVRALAAEIERAAPPPATVMASPILARGIAYYTRRPVTVLSHRERPFFTPHPLPVVVGPEGLTRFVGENGAVVCGMTARDWSRFARRLSPGERAETEMMADKVLARVTAARPASAGPAR